MTLVKEPITARGRLIWDLGYFQLNLGSSKEEILVFHHLELRVDGAFVSEVRHHRGKHPVAGRLARSRWPHKGRPEADVEYVEHLDDLAHEQRHLKKHVGWVRLEV